jgi:branched-chain amino acid transport system substrate-binding protein
MINCLTTPVRESQIKNLVGLILLGLSLGLVACRLPASASAPLTLKIGLVAPFEGTQRASGYEVLFAVKLAVQERNQAGGLAGYQVELVALNDFGEAGPAPLQAKALIADPDVVGVVGHLTAAATMAALPVYQAAELALSVPWPAPTTPNQGGVVNLTASEATMLARLQVLAPARLRPITQTNLALIRPDSQALLIEAEPILAGQILAALAQAEIELPRFAVAEAGGRQLVQVAGEAANGLLFVSPGPAATELDPASTFVQNYQRLAGLPPGPRAVLAYDATQVLLDAIAQAMGQTGRPPSRAEVKAALITVRRPGLSGAIAFDQQGQRLNPPVWVYQIADGRYPGRPIAGPQ